MIATSADLRTEMRARRKAAELTQAQLAALVGVSRVTIGKWERGASAPTWAQWDRWLGSLPILILALLLVGCVTEPCDDDDSAAPCDDCDPVVYECSDGDVCPVQWEACGMSTPWEYTDTGVPVDCDAVVVLDGVVALLPLCFDDCASVAAGVDDPCDAPAGLVVGDSLWLRDGVGCESVTVYD